MKLIDSIDLPDPRLMGTREGRYLAMKHDPLLFAFHYLPHHLKDKSTGDDFTLSEFHQEIIEYGRSWSLPDHQGQRNTFITARGGGKSTWLFIILPIWAGAFGHQRFVAAFSDSAAQAEMHLRSVKKEFNTNERLRADFPSLCTPRQRAGVSRDESYNNNEIIMQNDFVFFARGADTASLGMKVDSERPSLILLDDIEGGESNYSNVEMRKRLRTLTDDIFPLNVYADVAIVGTTTAPGSIIDQIKLVAQFEKEFEGSRADFRETLSPELRWVVDENINCTYYPAILDEDTDTMRSLWPEKWSLEWLLERRHQRQFKKNFMCRPISDSSEYWDDEDIKILNLEDYAKTVLSIDPAVTTNRKSDFTGLAVLSQGTELHKRNVFLRHVEQQKLSPGALIERVQELIEEYDVDLVIVETNMGGDLWKQQFAGLGAKFKFERATVKKEVRAQAALDWYQKERVYHVAHFPTAEEQLKNFPNVMHDDMVDAIAAGVKYFLGTKSGQQKFSAMRVNYNNRY